MIQVGTAWIAGDSRLFGLVAAGLSNLISNVPAVLVVQSLVPHITTTHTSAWVLLAASSTFAGNSTLLASIANLIVVERAAQQGITVGFRTYLSVGLPITIITLAIALYWLT